MRAGRWSTVAAAVALCAPLTASVVPGPVGRGNHALPPSSLAVDVGAGSAGSRLHTWWRAGRAPVRWRAALPAVAQAIAWQPLADGIEWGTLRLAGRGEAWRVRVIVVRVDPARVRFRLDTAFTGAGMAAAWTVGAAPRDAAVALNAGQFVGSMPWGWVVIDGRQFLSPGHGPLSSAVAIDTAGHLRWITGDSLAATAATGAPPGTQLAFQSYPTLLTGDGSVPAALQATAPNGGVDLGHRDARLAFGEDRAGRVVIALTRFDGLDGAMDFVPFGLTTPEMAALMGALGCRRAVALDGGISSQLLLRDGHGVVHEWHGLRKVPLGLLIEPRQAATR